MESTMHDKEEKLIAAYNSIIDGIPRLQMSLREGRINERFLSMTSWQYFQIFGLKSFFIDKDIHFAKLCFYKCGLLDELLINKYDENILNSGIVHFTYALLSDNKNLVERYANLKNSNYEQTLKLGFAAPMRVLQCLFKDDWNGFEQAMVSMNTKTVPKFKMELDAAFYRALAEKNKQKMEQVIAELLTPKVHKTRNKDQVGGDFISQPALGYAKLAWIKGIEIEVNSPLVPKALLPVAPLPEYKELDLFSMAH
jgi:hypothetical protein